MNICMKAAGSRGVPLAWGCVAVAFSAAGGATGACAGAELVCGTMGKNGNMLWGGEAGAGFATGTAGAGAGLGAGMNGMNNVPACWAGAG